MSARYLHAWLCARWCELFMETRAPDWLWWWALPHFGTWAYWNDWSVRDYRRRERTGLGHTCFLANDERAQPGEPF